MTNAQAQTVAHDLVAAGYNATALQSGGVWTVSASSSTGSVDCSVIASFATTHGVVSKADTAVFS